MSELEKVERLYPEEPRCALILLLDTSGSMGEDVDGVVKIVELNKGMKELKEQLSKDELARKRVEVAVVTFGGNDEVKIAHEFSLIQEFNPVDFEAYGSTPMGKAMRRAVELIELRKRFYKDNSIDYYRPWIFLITDGEATDMEVGNEFWTQVTKAVHKGEKRGKFLFWAVGVQEANMEKLRMISPQNRVPLKMKGVNFKEMFLWLSKSMKEVSVGRPGEQVVLPPPGWGKQEV